MVFKEFTASNKYVIYTFQPGGLLLGNRSSKKSVDKSLYRAVSSIALYQKNPHSGSSLLVDVTFCFVYILHSQSLPFYDTIKGVWSV